MCDLLSIHITVICTENTFHTVLQQTTYHWMTGKHSLYLSSSPGSSHPCPLHVTHLTKVPWLAAGASST